MRGDELPTTGLQWMRDVQRRLSSIDQRVRDLATNVATGVTNGMYVGADGKAYTNTDGGQAQLAYAADESSLAPNSDFETTSAGEPTDWSDFWANGGAYVTSDATVYLTGTRSAKWNLPAGGFAEVAYLSSPFAVAPNGIIEVDVFVQGDPAGDTDLSIELLSAASGTPSFFTPGVGYSPVSPVDLSGDGLFTRVTRTMVVPAGHIVGVLGIRGTKAVAGSRSLWVDTVSVRQQAITVPPVPVGAVLAWATGAIPEGYLECDGALHDVADYSLLAELLGTTYGGDGITDFAVPTATAPAGLGAYIIRT